MADGIVRVPPDSSGKIIDASQVNIPPNIVQRQRVNVGGNDVHRQRIVWADGTDPAGFVTVTDDALNVYITGLAATPLNIGTPTDGDVLTYDGTTGRWIAKTPTAVEPPTFNFIDGKVVSGSNTSWTLLHLPNPLTRLQVFQYITGFGSILVTRPLDYQIYGTPLPPPTSLRPEG